MARKLQIPFTLSDSADQTGRTGKKGMTFSGSEIQVSKNGGAWTDFAGTGAEVGGTNNGSGAYIYSPSQAELDFGWGAIGIKVKKAGCLLSGTNDTGVQVWANMSDVTSVGATIAGTLSATQFTTNLTETVDDCFKDCWIRFASGANKGQVKKCTAYDGSTKKITTDAFTNAPGAGDDFEIIQR